MYLQTLHLGLSLQYFHISTLKCKHGWLIKIKCVGFLNKTCIGHSVCSQQLNPKEDKSRYQGLGHFWDRLDHAFVWRIVDFGTLDFEVLSLMGHDRNMSDMVLEEPRCLHLNPKASKKRVSLLHWAELEHKTLKLAYTVTHSLIVPLPMDQEYFNLHMTPFFCL